MKIALKKSVPNDYYNLGKVYYNTKSWGKVDTTLLYYSSLMPEHVQGYLWRARALVNIDTTSKLGLAKPKFEKLIEVAKSCWRLILILPTLTSFNSKKRKISNLG